MENLEDIYKLQKLEKRDRDLEGIINNKSRQTWCVTHLRSLNRRSSDKKIKSIKIIRQSDRWL